MRTYADLEVSFELDCAVLAVTEHLGEPKLATLEPSPFSDDATSPR